MSSTVCWGHSTGVEEGDTKTFLNNWTGTGAISGAGDNEILTLGFGHNEESETYDLGAGEAAIWLDKYQAGSGGTPYIEYKTGNSEINCDADTWHAYDGISFTSLGWVKIRLTYPTFRFKDDGGFDFKDDGGFGWRDT